MHCYNARVAKKILPFSLYFRSLGNKNNVNYLFSNKKVRQSGTTVEAVQKECVALLGLTEGITQKFK
jgi:uncharacterized protein YbbK (DUF523 family)